jgi:hypothetical protein
LLAWDASEGFVKDSAPIGHLLGMRLRDISEITRERERRQAVGRPQRVEMAQESTGVAVGVGRGGHDDRETCCDQGSRGRGRKSPPNPTDKHRTSTYRGTR